MKEFEEFDFVGAADQIGLLSRTRAVEQARSIADLVKVNDDAQNYDEDGGEGGEEDIEGVLRAAYRETSGDAGQGELRNELEGGQPSSSGRVLPAGGSSTVVMPVLDSDFVQALLDDRSTMMGDSSKRNYKIIEKQFKVRLLGDSGEKDQEHKA